MAHHPAARLVAYLNYRKESHPFTELLLPNEKGSDLLLLAHLPIAANGCRTQKSWQQCFKKKGDERCLPSQSSLASHPPTTLYEPPHTHTALMCFVFNKAVLCTPIKLEKNVGCDRNARSSFHGLNLVISSHSGKLWCLTKEKTQPFREYQYEWSKKMVVYIQSQWALFSRCVSVTRLFDSAKISGKKSAKLGSNSLVWLQPYQSWTDHVMVNKLYI